jgi:hypothetical protein
MCRMLATFIHIGGWLYLNSELDVIYLNMTSFDLSEAGITIYEKV